VSDGEKCQGENVSASLTDLASHMSSQRIIADYTDYLSDKREYTRRGPYGEIVEAQTMEPNDVPRFYSTTKTCPFCNSATNQVFDDYYYVTMGVDFVSYVKAYECGNCGWWTINNTDIEEKDYVNEVDSYITEGLRWGIVRKFSVEDKDVPVSAFVSALRKDPDLVYSAHHRKFEEIAQYVFSSFFSCKVEHIGKTGDGGVDLIRHRQHRRCR
jgi:restriction system protein